MTAFTTASNVNDTTMLPVMLEMMRRQGLDLSGHFFDGDKGYDSDENCEMLFEMGLIPNIKQRRDAVNRGKPSRSKAARLFNQDEYRKRGMIEGVFGAEETKRHQLHCRFIREDNRFRFAKIRAIAWNRIACCTESGTEIPPPPRNALSYPQMGGRHDRVLIRCQNRKRARRRHHSMMRLISSHRAGFSSLAIANCRSSTVSMSIIILLTNTKEVLVVFVLPTLRCMR